ncbi:hypothetical protein [Streptomyces sp. NBC_00162]|uniref:hypothetical protein n=1 Tax=Streptomyces sp. NBC_00162 TaxID=2903629 RepID=UPI00214C6AC8|nr:hypothetical protein [Streptomyces sp. NBC_00162]UUU44925.1 hypothetical protein JIW86_00970 [Streptomyces sp. NBC_00162]
MTRRDLLEDNADLLARAGELLRTRTVHIVTITDASHRDDALQLKLKATNVDRVDIYVDQRPRTTVDLANGQVDVTVPGTASAQSVRVDGFFERKLVASRTAQL